MSADATVNPASGTASAPLRVAVAGDHAGLVLADVVTQAIADAGGEPVPVGPRSGEPVDYPLVARAAAQALASGDVQRAVVLCGSGAGVTMAANKYPGVRAAGAADTYTAHQMVEHDDANVLTLGGRIIGPEVAAEAVRAFVAARFSGIDRHARRLGQVLDAARDRHANPCQDLRRAGQSIWLDVITRDLVRSGQLAAWTEERAVTGLTSNPTIYEQAVTGTGAYDDDIARLAAGGATPTEIVFALELDDLRRAAWVLRVAWEASLHADGWVSLEVDPHLADDAAATVAQAVELHAAAGVPNLLVKVPGTPAGRVAVEELCVRGVPVNVTLLFSPEHVVAAVEAWMAGLERRRDAGQPLDAVTCVQSVFVSRWDKATQSTLPAGLYPGLAVAVARQTYRAHEQLLAGERWAALEAGGARRPRLLWASTGTKDPALGDTYYLDALVAPATITTVPEATLDAFADHGRPGPALPLDGGDADAVVAEVQRSGVDVDALAERLQVEGKAAFVASWDSLLRQVAARTGTGR